jgi:hypothetical protein
MYKQLPSNGGKPKMLGKTKSYLAGAILLVFSVGLADVSE